MKTSKEILENLIDALIEAEPILFDRIREPLRYANDALTDIQNLADELNP